MMINIWGVCEFGEMTHDPLRQWGFSCNFFIPAEEKRVEVTEKCCANCIYWLVADEKLKGDPGK